MTKIAIISDDLTGAADTGIQFVYAGLRPDVLLDANAGCDPSADVLVGVTETRQDPPELAREKVARWAGMLAGHNPAEVYKKIDSALRGNAGAELDACMKAFPGRLVIFAPAYPAAGRTTVDGRHYVHGRPLEESEVARDPTTPVRESFIPKLLTAQTSRSIGQVRLADLEAGPGRLARLLLNHVAEGTEILVSDAVTDQHLAALVAGVRTLGRPVLWTGSAGLARQVVPVTVPSASEAELPGALPLLTIAGSVTGTLRRQVEHYCTATGTACITADSDLLTGPAPQANAEVIRVAAEALAELNQGRSAVVTTSLPPGSIANPGPHMVDTARAIAHRLGAVAQTILGSGSSSSLFLSGGDTALGVCRHLGASGIRLHRELLPGIALGTLVGGDHAGLPIITKAGSFGEVDVLCQISRLLPSPWATRPVSDPK